MLSDLGKRATEYGIMLAEAYVKRKWQEHKDKKIINKIRSGEYFEEYLRKTTKSHATVKTLLNVSESFNLADIYECPDIRKWLPTETRAGANKRIPTKDIHKIIGLGQRTIITGTAGAGKSLLARHIFLNAVNSKVNYIPIFIELRKLNEKEREIDTKEFAFSKRLNLKEFIYSELKDIYFDMPYGYFSNSLELGKYLFLFDGLDEVSGEMASALTRQIEDFCGKYNDNYYIVTSRPDKRFFGRLKSFDVYECAPLLPKQAQSMARSLPCSKEKAREFSKQLEEGLYEKYREFASVPLLLTILYITYKAPPIPGEKKDLFEIDPKDLFSRAFYALFHEHESQLKEADREKKSKLGHEAFRKVFERFCFQTLTKVNDWKNLPRSMLTEELDKVKEKDNKIDFLTEGYIEDLCKAVCMLVDIDGGYTYDFVHRSFQEYFAAEFAFKNDSTETATQVINWIKREVAVNVYDGGFIDKLFKFSKNKFKKRYILPALEEIMDTPEEEILKKAYLAVEWCEKGTALLTPNHKGYTFFLEFVQIPRHYSFDLDFDQQEKESAKYFVEKKGYRNVVFPALTTQDDEEKIEYERTLPLYKSIVRKNKKHIQLAIDEIKAL